MRVAFVSEDWHTWGDVLTPGGCTYYRQLLPANAAGPLHKAGRPAWSAQRGFGVMVGRGIAQFGFDTVCMKMMMARWMPEQMRRAQALGQRLIVDMDDHYDALHEVNLARAATDPASNPIHNRDHLRAVIMQADTLTVSTPLLYQHYLELGVQDVRLIRNGINPHQFTPRKPRNRKPVFGWVGALGWRSNDMQELAGWLPGFLQQHDLGFHHAGTDPQFPPIGPLIGVPDTRLSTEPMRIITEYQHMLTRFDVGLVPLAPIPFNAAKSCIKGLEYAAAGVPFIASATAEYVRLAELGVGRVARTPDEWLRHASELLDYGTRKREAARNRALVLKHHTIVSRAPEWADLFAEGPTLPALPTKLVQYQAV